MRILGLMSGTSMDGIDAALCEITGSGQSLRAEIIGFECFSYEESLKERISRTAQNLADVREVARLNVAIGRAFGAAAITVFEKHGRSELIASHGQTICHLPDEGATLQIGDAATICEMTGCDVVSNFRARDMACGGQGAPLVPYVDWCLLTGRQIPRVVLNIGGIANATMLPANTPLAEVRASDIGPGNMVIDALARHFFNLGCDPKGSLAAQGTVVEKLLEELLSHSFFERQPPKTTGREEFGQQFAARLFKIENPYDALATATKLTAVSIARFLEEYGFDEKFQLIVGGGGIHNQTLMGMLRSDIPHATIHTHEDFGIDSNAKEALAFAILGYETMQGVHTNVRGATGANKIAVLGDITRY